MEGILQVRRLWLSFCSFCWLFSFNFLVLHVVYSLSVKVDTSQTSCFTSTGAHVGEVVAANFASLCYFNFFHERAVEHEALFYTDTACNTANGDTARVATLAVSADNKTLEDLNTLFVAFFNFLVDFNSVTAFNVDNRWFLELFFNFFE